MSDVSTRNTYDQVADCSPLSQECIRALIGRMEDKRKFAANEIEKMTVEFSMSNNLTMVNRLIIVLGRYCLSPNNHTRKGGLLGLAAVMVGFKNGSTTGPTPDMVDEVIRPILTCLLDSDSQVRYYACESLLNATKVARSNILPMFDSIFDTLTRVVADNDPSVRTASENLDRLIKDIVVESSNDELDIESFVVQLRKYMDTENPFTRMFLISWIRLLDTKMDIISHLPHLLDGILKFLLDTPEEICASTLVLLSEFLKKIVNLTQNDDMPSSSTPKALVNQEKPQTNFHDFVVALYKTFHANDQKFEDRSKFIIINLCSMTKPETVYRSFAEIIKEEKSDAKFAHNLVQKLNQILLTDPTLIGLRSRLSNCCSSDEDNDPEMIDLYSTLVDAWSQSPVASVSLCLLAGDYKQAKELVMGLSKAEVSMDLLIQVDWIIQLIESPIFTSLRLHLLDQKKGSEYLIQALYGLLMILPQSDAYKKLSHRLDQVHNYVNILQRLEL